LIKSSSATEFNHCISYW